jgi:hypothetical protein
MKYTVEMASCGMIYITSFIESGTVVQAMLSFASYLRGTNIDITNVRDL